MNEVKNEEGHPTYHENRQLSAELLNLMSKIGNLHLHVSGEGKVDFLGEGTKGWVGMYSVIYSGDIGCLIPYENYPKCALDNAVEALGALECLPHLNSSINEKYTPDSDQWAKFVLDIKQYFIDMKPGEEKAQYQFKLELAGDDDVLLPPSVVVTLKPLCNEFVVGEFNATKKYNYIGQITDFDQPKIKNCFIVAEEKEYEIELDKLLHFRNKSRWEPSKGDYLLFNPETSIYVILPKEDYSIH